MVGPLVAPPFPTGRLGLRLTPDRGGRAALSIYRPLARTGRLLRDATSASSKLRFLPARESAIIEALTQLLDLPVDGACVMRSSTPGREIVGLSTGGRLVAVAKVGSPGDARLRNEARMLAQLGAQSAVRTPRLMAAGGMGDAFVCVTEAVLGPPRPELAEAEKAAWSLAVAGVTHGDLAPWNLVGEPATVLDWESAGDRLRPMFDLAHFVIRREASLGPGDAEAVVAELCGPVGVGATHRGRREVVEAAAGAGAEQMVLNYLDFTEGVPCGRGEVRLRSRVRTLLGRTDRDRKELR